MTTLTRCSVPSCTEMIPVYKFLCPHHWRLLPLAEQKAVNNAVVAYNHLRTSECFRRLREARAAALQSIAK
jgi:hypothetical protein